MYDILGKLIIEQDEGWQLIRDRKLKCENDCERKATDFHNHGSNDPEEWMALCAICHAEIEARGSVWTPIGMLAVRYIDIVRAYNQLNNLQQVRVRLGWDGVETDLNIPLSNLDAQRKTLATHLRNEAKRHPMWKNWLGHIQGVGELSGALLISVMERAWAVGVMGVRSQRKYFGFVPDQNEQYNHTCKWLISQALNNSIQMQLGMFGELYKQYRPLVDEAHPDWNKGHCYRETWSRIAREFLKALSLVWLEWQGKTPGKRNPADDSPLPDDWMKKEWVAAKSKLKAKLDMSPPIP